MAQLVGLIVSEDESFKKPLGRLLRSGTVPVSVIDEALTSPAALVFRARRVIATASFTAAAAGTRSR